MRYAQILDTDNENYVVLYECFENAKYFSKKENKLEFSKRVWNKGT